MKKITILLFIVIVMISGSLFADSVIEVTPSVNLSEEYNDNIYLDKTDKISDWMTTLSPGIALNISSQKNNFILNYFPTIVRYKERSQNNTVRQALSFSLASAISQHFNFDMNDTFLRSEQPIEQTADIISDRKTRSPYYRNNGSASINYIFGPSSSFLMGFNHSLLRNTDKTLDDGTIFKPYADYSYWFNVKHGLELNAGYTNANFSRGDNAPAADDYTGFTDGIGYRYRYDPHSTFFMHYDFTDRNFKGASTDYKVYEGKLGFEKNVSEDMSYNLSAGYFIRHNEIGNNDNGLNADISFTKNINRGSFSVAGKSGWGEAYLESESRGFTKFQSITSTFNYQVTESLNNYVSVTYRQDKDETSRKSKTLRTNYGWRWSFLRYYSIAIDYSCDVRRDDIATDEYLVNKVMLNLRWSRPYR